MRSPPADWPSFSSSSSLSLSAEVPEVGGRTKDLHLKFINLRENARREERREQDFTRGRGLRLRSPPADWPSFSSSSSLSLSAERAERALPDVGGGAEATRGRAIRLTLDACRSRSQKCQAVASNLGLRSGKASGRTWTRVHLRSGHHFRQSRQSVRFQRRLRCQLSARQSYCARSQRGPCWLRRAV